MDKEMDWIKVKKDDAFSIGNYIWVKCIAEIRNNATNEIREYETDEILEIGNEYPNTFNWEKNNFSCDCNRRMFFKSVKGEETNEDWNAKCSDGEFSVNLKNKKDGKIYYREFK